MRPVDGSSTVAAEDRRGKREASTIDDRFRDDHFRDWETAYMLGVLDPAARRDYERHVSGCDECDAALRDLARLSGDDVDSARAAYDRAEPVRELRTAAESAPTATRRRLRRRVSVVVASSTILVLLLVGTAFGSVLPLGSGVPGPGADTRPMQPFGSTAATARVRVVAADWGTQLAWSIDYGVTLDGSTDYEMVVVTTDGQETSVATWRGTGRRATGLAAAVSTPVSQIRSAEIRVQGASDPLLQVTL